MIRWRLVASIAELEDVVVAAKIRSHGAIAPMIELIRHLEPNLAIVATGCAATAASTLSRLRVRFPALSLLGVTPPGPSKLVAGLLRAGATGIAQTTQPRAELLDAIRVTSRGSRYVPPAIVSGDVERELDATDVAGVLDADSSLANPRAG
jgi:DNA-binding NarL/FixJ family response regulator